MRCVNLQGTTKIKIISFITVIRPSNYPHNIMLKEKTLRIPKGRSFFILSPIK